MSDINAVGTENMATGRRSKAGRKRSGGKRHPGGQLVRTPKIDKGTIETQRRRAQYALGKDPAQTIDALGRAWCAGLITDDERDAGRRFAALYWRKLPAPNPISSLYHGMVSGLVDELPPGVDREATIEDADARDSRQEHALNGLLARINGLGADRRRAFDQMVLDPWCDAGPPWLDHLLSGRSAAVIALEADRRAGAQPGGRDIEDAVWPAFVYNAADAVRSMGHAITALRALLS